MLASAVAGIRNVSPVPVEFLSFISKGSRDRERLKDLKIDLAVYPWTRLNIRKVNLIFRWCCFISLPLLAILYRALRTRSSRLLFLKAYLEADLIIDLSGDSLSSDYPEYALANSILPLAIARILNKPYMMCAQSLGPFRDTFIQRILIAILRDADLITTRERISDDILSALHIQGNVIPTQDLAFTIQPVGRERVNDICRTEGIDPALPWVGLSVSALISAYAFKELEPEHRKGAYIEAMGAFADWMASTYGFNILFIPHVAIPGVGDDAAISREIYCRMKCPEKARLLAGAYVGDELKAIIGLCKFFVGSRMHATIGALSQGIPTMTYVYNHKSIGINGNILRQSEYLIDIREVKSTELLERSIAVFRKLEQNAVLISGQLKGILPNVVEQARFNAWAAVNLLEIAGPLQQMHDPELCTGCGACVAACASNALAMRYTREGTLRPCLVRVCKQCSKCTKVCPAMGIDIGKEEQNFFGKQAEDAEIGVVSAAFKGYAKDSTLRWRRSSGGLVSATLAHLFDARQIDAALAVVDDPQNPLLPKAVWVTSAEELRLASCSKYTPVALLKALSDIQPRFEKIALVGLPCHLWGLRKLESNRILKDNAYIVRLGLFCNRTPSGHATELLLRKHGLAQKDVREIRYRGNGWPGSLKIHASNREVFYPQNEIWPFLASPFFLRKHCYFCGDYFARLADLSFGDAWLPECMGDTNGWSVCLVRSKRGAEVIKLCQTGLQLEEIPTNRIKEAFGAAIKSKYGRGMLKEVIYPECAAVRLPCHGARPKPKIRDSALIRLEHSLTEFGKSRVFQGRFLDHPANLFMKINNRLLNFLAK